MQHRVGISVITLFPFSWGPWGPWFLGRYYQKTGIPFQLVPLLFWSKKSLWKHVPIEAVVSYEGPWNQGETFRQTLGRVFGKDPAALLGLLLFGIDRIAQKKVAWFQERYPHAFAVDLGGNGEKDLREISPYNTAWKDAPRLVYDTLHGKEAALSADDLVILRDRIHLIHLQTRNRESFEGFLKGDFPDDLMEDLWLIPAMKAPIIFEFPPQFLWPDVIEKSIWLRARLLYRLFIRMA